MVDVDAHVSYQFRCDIRTMVFDVRHPVVRCVGLTVAMTEDEDRACGGEFVGDLLPVGRTVVFVGPRWVPGFMVDLVEPPVRIGSHNALGPLSGLRIGGVDVRVAEGNDGDHVLVSNELPDLVNHQTSLPFSSSYPTARWKPAAASIRRRSSTYWSLLGRISELTEDRGPTGML